MVAIRASSRIIVRPVLSFAKKLPQRADGVTQSDVDAVFAVGWNETAVYHLVVVVALLWNGKVIAESDRTEVVRGNHYFRLST
jgi:hypothetical protein